MRALKIWGMTMVVVIAVLGLYIYQNNREYQIILLNTNDSHGSILPVDSVGGMAERATFIRMVREKNPYVLLVDAGDINTGQAISNTADAKPDILAYNYMGYDAVTVGNHEFDKPLNVLLKQMQWAEFPFVTSNIQRNGTPLGVEYLIKEIGGVKIGIFGLTTKNTENVSIHAGEVTFENEVMAARKVVKLLKKQQVNLIIGLVHLGFTESAPGFITSYRLAQEVDGIDILVDGHSHSFIERPEHIHKTTIVTANQSGRYVGEGIIRMKKGRFVGFYWKPVLIKGFQPDSVLSLQLRPYVEAAEKDLATVVGEATEEFSLFQDGENLARYGETALGDLVADALKWKAGKLNLKVDFALTNSGGIRESLPAGKITKGDVLAVLPFDNVLEVVALSGSEVRRLFDYIASIPLGNGAFAQVSREVRVVYDSGRVRTLTIAGRPIEDDKMYYMATCDYVAAGKDGYEAGLENITGRENTSRSLSDVLIEYIQTKGKIIPRVDGRIKFTD